MGKGGCTMDYPKGRYAWSVTVGTKGQIVIPKQAREVFGIESGDTLLILADEDKGIAIPPKSSMSGIARMIFGDQESEE
jgi:AbrB family looped-hinge helix DNA binding protein